MQRKSSFLKSVGLVIVFTIIGLELVCRADPFGVLKYLESQHRVVYATLDNGLRRPMPQEMRVGDSMITVLSDTTRFIPDDPNGECNIAVVGDSMAWGWEIDDHQTWVNQLAQHTAGVHFENWAVPGYNILETLDTVRTLPPFDGYIYLYFENDGDIDHTVGVAPSWSAALTYFNAWGVTRNIETMPDEQIIGLLKQFPHNTFVFGFAMPATVRLSEQYPLTVIPFYSSFISKADWHPDARGHEQIYDAIGMQLQSFIVTVCANAPDVGGSQ